MELKKLLNLRVEQRRDMCDRMRRHEVFTVLARVGDSWFSLHHDAEIPGKDKEGTFKTKNYAMRCAKTLTSYPEVNEVLVVEVSSLESSTSETIPKG